MQDQDQQDQDQNGDHDLIPDVLQKSAEGQAPEAAEHEFGQMAKRPAKEPPVKEKKPGVLGRLFGTPKKTEPWHKHHEEPKPLLKPKSDAWAPFTLKTGFYKDPHLYKQNTSSVARHMRGEFKKVLPKFSQSNELAKRLAPKKGKGFSRSEFRGAVEGMVEEGKLKPSQAKRALRRYKGYK